MHCLLTITQSTLVPSLGCDCAGGQSPDSAHPFPEGELWKPKTAAIPSHLPPHHPPLILCSCLSLPLSLSPSLWPVTWQRPCIKGNYRTMQGASQEFEEPFFFFFFETGISYGRVLSYPGWTISAARNRRKKSRAQPKQSDI